MGSATIATEALCVDRGAEFLYDQGRAATQDGNAAGANKDFRAALQHLEYSPVTFDAEVQAARIGRNMGFAWVRTAIESNDTRLLHRGGEQILHCATSLKKELGQERDALTTAARKEAIAEYGAAISFLGRTATATQIMRQDTGATSARIREAAKWGSKAYEQAHELLKEGSNGYHRVSNAMAAARHERVNGRVMKAAAWTGRAAVGLAWTATHDRKNLINTLRATSNRTRQLLTRSIATRSIKTKP